MHIVEKYFAEFGQSQRSMAASVEALFCCEKIIQSAYIDSILDLGSGLSSVFFHSRFGNVTTLDDSEYWAERTKSFISAILNKQIQIGSISSVGNQKFDFVFYDYGNMETRILHFRKALEMCTCYFYIDDFHVSYYQQYIKAKFSRFKTIPMPETRDEYGRYGALIIKKELAE